jgi:hypothetical protein
VSRLRRTWPWALLLTAALLLGLATGGGTPDDSPTPSIANPGPKGAKVLHTWLTERGAQVQTLTEPLTKLPAGLDVVVLAAPIDRQVTGEEVRALEQFVRQGGTLVYLSPRPARLQPRLKKWLGLAETSTALPEVKDTTLGDLGGATIEVTSSSERLRGVKQLRVSADLALELDAPDATQAAGKALWVRPMGSGEVWIAAGADLIENRRLDLLDNLQLWANLPPARIAFDEFHHRAAAPPRWSANLWASFFQVIFIGLLFVAARARRLGPARATPTRQHRSSLEYVASMGGLMRRAGVEGELKLALRDRLRRLMQERLGIPLALGADEASRLLATQTGIATDAWLQLDQRLVNPEADFVAAAAEAARLEDAIVGRKG